MKKTLFAVVMAALLTVNGTMVSAQDKAAEAPKPVEQGTSPIAPSLPEVKGPDVKRPEVPEVTAPAVPVKPAVPEIQVPEAPKVPEVKVPEAPKTTAIPEVSGPVAPVAPVPEVTVPAVPEVKTPVVPQPPAVPATPANPDPITAPEPPRVPVTPVTSEVNIETSVTPVTSEINIETPATPATSEVKILTPYTSEVKVEVKVPVTVDTKEIKHKDVEFKIGMTTTPDMKVRSEKKKFKMGDPIFYSVFSKKNKKLEADMTVDVNLVDASTGAKTKIEEIKTSEKELNRPVNPVTVEKAGKYILEFSAGDKVLARRSFEVIEAKKAEKKEEKK